MRHMPGQLRLTEQRSPWELDDRTREIGLAGVQMARQALAETVVTRNVPIVPPGLQHLPQYRQGQPAPTFADVPLVA